MSLRFYQPINHIFRLKTQSICFISLKTSRPVNLDYLCLYVCLLRTKMYPKKGNSIKFRDCCYDNYMTCSSEFCIPLDKVETL